MIRLKVKEYLEKRAFKKWLRSEAAETYELVIIMPAIKEYETLPNAFKSLSKCGNKYKSKSLILVVINNSDQSNLEIRENNYKTIQFIENAKSNNKYGLNIEYIDAASLGRELPNKDAGVGLARKIGMDQALIYLDYNKKVNGLVFLDSDCLVEENYLEELYKHFEKNKRTAGVINYRHKLENDAIICYEIFLRYYVLGLKFANSPYAHHSIGSCVFIDPETYIKIGGMNKKKAGEDFYFLEKAAKVINITQLEKTKVYPSARKSWRVPFGTGRSITRYYNNEKDEYQLYDPDSFIVLKNFLQEYFSNNKPREIINKSQKISSSLYEFLIEIKFEENLNRIIDNTKNSQQLYNQKKIWFDGFKTMKLIHYLRDNGYPQKPMFTALNELFRFLSVKNFTCCEKENPDREIQKQYLEQLRELT